MLPHRHHRIHSPAVLLKPRQNQVLHAVTYLCQCNAISLRAMTPHWLLAKEVQVQIIQCVGQLSSSAVLHRLGDLSAWWENKELILIKNQVILMQIKSILLYCVFSEQLIMSSKMCIVFIRSSNISLSIDNALNHSSDMVFFK